jgi:hypothetical protein
MYLYITSATEKIGQLVVSDVSVPRHAANEFEESV